MTSNTGLLVMQSIFMNEKNANEHRFSTEKDEYEKKEEHFYYIYVALI